VALFLPALACTVELPACIAAGAGIAAIISANVAELLENLHAHIHTTPVCTKADPTGLHTVEPDKNEEIEREEEIIYRSHERKLRIRV
jgi:hypothetical protein